MPLIKVMMTMEIKLKLFKKNEKWQKDYRSTQICEMSHLLVGTILKDKEQTMKSEILRSKQRTVVARDKGK